MKKALLIILLLINTMAIQAQDAPVFPIEGTITNLDTREPLEWATVELMNVQDSVVYIVETNEEGFYSFDTKPKKVIIDGKKVKERYMHANNTYLITVAKERYDSMQAYASTKGISKDSTLVRDFELIYLDTPRYEYVVAKYPSGPNTSTTYKVYENKKITFDELNRSGPVGGLLIVDGANNVFEFIYKSWNPHTVDGDTDSRIIFEVSSELDSFELKDIEIFNNNGFYGVLCRCSNKGWHPINKGNIKGVKKADRWEIEIDATAILHWRRKVIERKSEIKAEFIISNK